MALAGVVDTFDAIQSLAGDDVAGLGSISELGRAQEPIELVMLVRGLLLLRPLSAEGALEAVINAATAAAPRLPVAQELSRALPEHAWLLGPGGTGRLAALPTEERERVTGEIRGYLEAHPELAALAEAAGTNGAGTTAAAAATDAG